MAQKTVFLDHRIGGQFFNAYSVVLGSQDGSYGIKKASTGEIIVSNNTSVDNPSDGKYEYTFNIEFDTIYNVSWKVQSTASLSPVYEVTRIGPFFEESTVTKAVTESIGTLKQGTTGSFVINITDFDGSPIDPESITYSIINRDTDDVVVNSCPEKVKSGLYIFDWDIDIAQESGRYRILWNYTSNNTEYEEIQNFVISKDCDDPTLYSGRTLLIRQALELMISDVQRIPVYFQQAQPSRDRRRYRWNKGNWNQTPGLRIYRNKQIINGGYEVDFFKGEVVFDSTLTEFDNVNADFTFKWFTDEQLNRFISNGLHKLNSFAPHTNYNIGNLPEKYIATLLYNASTDAIRSLLMSLNFQEPIQYFGGPEEASKRFGQLEALKKNYEEEAKMLLEQKKFFPYVGLTRTIIVPEYSLPGGRSRWFRNIFKGAV